MGTQARARGNKTTLRGPHRPVCRLRSGGRTLELSDVIFKYWILTVLMQRKKIYFFNIVNSYFEVKIIETRSSSIWLVKLKALSLGIGSDNRKWVC